MSNIVLGIFCLRNYQLVAALSSVMMHLFMRFLKSFPEYYWIMSIREDCGLFLMAALLVV